MKSWIKSDLFGLVAILITVAGVCASAVRGQWIDVIMYLALLLCNIVVTIQKQEIEELLRLSKARIPVKSS